MQIKVTDTRMHSKLREDSTLTIPKEIQIPVVEAELVLLGTMRNDLNEVTLLIPQEWSKVIGPILISNTEKIERGDLFYCSVLKTIQEAGEYTEYAIHRKKVLALAKHFSPKHLQAIVDGKMKEGDKVLVEYEEWATVKQDTNWIYKGLRLKVNSVYVKEDKYGNHGGGRCLRLSLIGTEFEDKHLSKDTVIWENDLIIDKQVKLNSSNHITLHKKEEKMYKRPDVVTLVLKMQNDYTEYKKSCHFGPDMREIAEWTDKWLNDNL